MSHKSGNRFSDLDMRRHACPGKVGAGFPIRTCAEVLAPIAQLAERTAYTRRELRTGARLEVRVLLGVPMLDRARAHDLCPVAQWNESTAVRKRGSRVRVAPGQPVRKVVRGG